MLGHRQLTLDDYLDISRRRWWILAAPAILMPIMAYALTFCVTPRYESQTLVLVEQQTVPDDYVKPVVSEDLTGRLASMQEQILSRSRLEPIIQRYHLYASQTSAMDDRISQARKSITVKPIQSNIERTGGLPGFFVSFQASDPRIAQLVCGEITSLFVTQNLQSRELSAQDTTDFIREQLETAKRSLDDQDAKLAAFQRRYFGKLPGEESANVNMLASLNMQFDAATQALARLEQEKSYSEMLLAQQSGSTITQSGHKVIAPQPKQLELQQLQKQEADLKMRYTDDYPDVVAVRNKIKDLRKEIAEAPVVANASDQSTPAVMEPAGVQQLRAQIHADEQGITMKKRDQAQIQTQIAVYQDRIRSSPEVQEQYKQLTRDYETAKKFHDDLLSKMNQSKMATDLERRHQGEQFRVVDQPNLPEQPIFPKRRAFLTGGVAGGLGLGLLIISLLEYRDTSLRSERDVLAFTNLPTLGVIGFVPNQQPAPTNMVGRHHRPKRKLPSRPVVDLGAG